MTSSDPADRGDRSAPDRAATAAASVGDQPDEGLVEPGGVDAGEIAEQE